MMMWTGLVALLVVIGLAWWLLPVREWIQSFVAWIRESGAWGVLIFSIAYIVVVILLAPAEIMTIAAGLVFGAWGFPLVVVSATIGAALAFLISRLVVRDRVRAFIERRPLLEAVDNSLGEEGWKIVLLLRLNPLVPFNLQNYFFGATEIGFLPYAAATFFGIMPGTAMYVYVGMLGQAAVETGVGAAPKFVFLAAGLIAAVAVIVIVTRKAKAKLAHLGVTDDRLA